ncbi:hypothetical protein ACF0H5_002921 [Mactra antiquata]
MDTDESRPVSRLEISVAYQDCADNSSKGLTKSQARDALFEAGQNPTKLDIDEYWHQKQKKGNDVITLDELQELNERLGDPKLVIKNALRFFDKDKNDKIDRDELYEILKQTDQLEGGLKDVETYVDHILKLGDRNGDKMIDIDDLVMMIQDGLCYS